MEKQKRIIGITGGVGAGKSSVLEILKTKYGAKILLADLVAHELMEPGSEGLKRVVDALGNGFLKGDGSVDRKALADLLFRDPQALKQVNSIIHPMVWEYMKSSARESEQSLIVIEAAVFDTAPAGLFDEIWYVYTSEENRIQRLMESRGYTREKCESIIKRQDSEAAYRKIADRMIDNNKTAKETEQQIKEILGHEIC
jgi:dephospho-CoA kinase